MARAAQKIPRDGCEGDISSSAERQHWGRCHSLLHAFNEYDSEVEDDSAGEGEDDSGDEAASFLVRGGVLEALKMMKH
jgi:hypothetical protein